jgi:hypothetical protein
MFSLEWKLVPIPRFACSRVIFLAVYQLRNNLWIVPRPSLLVGVLIIKEVRGEIYEKYVDKDGFLYITYSAQQTFG